MEALRNNLDKATSPYLRQHKDNPVWWQEWNKETLDYAREKGKLIFASVGYAACHWCHTMAQGAFSDRAVAGFLNQDFVSLKIDREERPDIDRYLMSLSLAATGTGGWPLNAVLTADLRPITVFTYLPAPGMLDILKQAKEFYNDESGRLRHFIIPSQFRERIPEDQIIEKLGATFDFEHGGFSWGAKFPPHSLLLFMLYYFGVTKDARLSLMLEKTLDAMLLGGLHDHLQGGFFRYCVDSAWTTPHFEKMLYDQALLLWTYALAAKVLGKQSYAVCAARILRCLDETFAAEGLYYSAHDADTDHEEGGVYLWKEEELRRVLSASEYARLAQEYRISKAGNLAGKNHLIKKQDAPARQDAPIGQVEEKLLRVRKGRTQPFVDKKIVTSANALVGIGLVHAGRYLEDRALPGRAEALFKELVRRHYAPGGMLSHSSIEGRLQKGEFLQDYAAMLLFATYLYEETGVHLRDVENLYAGMKRFQRDGDWIEAHNPDFLSVPAEITDYGVPSSASLAGLAAARAELALGKGCLPEEFGDPLSHAFANIAALIKNGYFYVIQNSEIIGWKSLPANTLQLKGRELTVCYQKSCGKELP